MPSLRTTSTAPVGNPPLPASYAYLISGLRMVADLELPSASPCDYDDAQAEVRIAQGQVPEYLEAASRVGPDWETAEASFLLRVPGVGRFLMTGGFMLTYAPERNSDPGDIALYVLGTCLAVLLQQRGNLVLHASAVSVFGRAVLFCGPSGAGKSTMAALLSQHGYSLLNDDTCSVTLAQDGSPIVPGDGRMLKLWQNSVDHLSLDALHGIPVRRNTSKYYLHPASSDVRPRPVGAVYILAAAASGIKPTLTQLTPIQATTALRENAYRSSLVQAMQLTDRFFLLSAALQRHSRIYELRRSINFEQTDQLLDFLQKHWKSEFNTSGGQR